MSSQPVEVPISSASITPIQRKPLANVLVVTSERSATINYLLGQRIPGSAEVPAVPGVVGRGCILDDKGIATSPAIPGRAEVPAVPAVPDKLDIIEQDTIVMTDAEWSAWKDQDDNKYRLSVVAARLGLTLS